MLPKRFFWNFRTENEHAPEWDYLLGWREGWMPANASNREPFCTVLPLPRMNVAFKILPKFTESAVYLPFSWRYLGPLFYLLIRPCHATNSHTFSQRGGHRHPRFASGPDGAECWCGISSMRPADRNAQPPNEAQMQKARRGVSLGWPQLI